MKQRSAIVILAGMCCAFAVSGCTSGSVDTASTGGAATNQRMSDNIRVEIGTNSNSIANVPTPVKELTAPLDRPADRITKKTFSMHIIPATSPVQPEKFSGYHTGVDFEILPGEENIDVRVAAACTGKVRVKQWVSGYGGVLVQDCVLNGEKVTVLYGHLNIDNIAVSVGDTLNQGDLIGNLGKGYSTQTDGERKHLHLSIHKGTGVNYKGYVSTEAAFGDWLDPQAYW
ncbi:MAG: M23 family metallopeptidase [Patescibacteria group bacterium]|nr:M23 family metallopeptidase [Patescibacteria group bacterium]MDD5716105.1 M23 family metallopeptidase [Patescibacteria group bacterium]